MALPEGHREKVCVRDGTWCPHLVAIADGRTMTKRYDCMKWREGTDTFLETLFSFDPELAAHFAARPKEKGHCSGAPAFVEYRDD